MDQPYYSTLMDAVVDVPDPPRPAASVIPGLSSSPSLLPPLSVTNAPNEPLVSGVLSMVMTC